MADWRLAGCCLAAGLQLAGGWLTAGWRLGNGLLAAGLQLAPGYLAIFFIFLP